MKYFQNFKIISWNFLNNLFIFLFIASISINRRILIKRFSEIPNDYQSIFINLSDLVIILFLIYFLITLLLNKNTFLEFKIFIRSHKYIVNIGIIFLIISLISVINSVLPVLSFSVFLRLKIILLFSFCFGFFIFKNNLVNKLLTAIVFMGVFNSFLAAYQFFTFRSFGLHALGEVFLSFLPGISKVAFPGAVLVRGYGLFSHPNILGAYLFLCVMICAYFIEKLIINHSRIRILKLAISEIALIICVFGMMVSFSRSAMAASFISLSLFYLILFYSRRKFKSIIKKTGSGRIWFGLISVILSIFIAVFALGDIILPRFQNIAGSSALLERISYSQMALSTISDSPILGVGIGSSVAYSIRNNIYSFFGFKDFWEFEPVHNLYLLIASEMGIIGLFIFLLCIFYILIKSSKSLFYKTENKLLSLLCFCVLIGNLMLGIFDHYFWDSSSGILIFWVIAAISLSLIFSEKQKKLQGIIY